jgi:hypothetical protein
VVSNDTYSNISSRVIQSIILILSIWNDSEETNIPHEMRNFLP